MGVKKNYRVVVKTPFQKYKSQRYDMNRGIELFLKILNQYGLICDYDKGEFVITPNPFTNEILYKKYRIIINVPYTELELIKLDKGSINLEELTSTIKTIKEVYYNEGI